MMLKEQPRVPQIINGVPHTMELDMGASVTIMSEEECRRIIPGVVMRNSSLLFDNLLR